MNENLMQIYTRLRTIDSKIRDAINAPTKHEAGEILWSARGHLADIEPLVARAFYDLVNPPAPFDCPDAYQEELKHLEEDRKSGRRFLYPRVERCD
jgi:hypothetical protein